MLRSQTEVVNLFDHSVMQKLNSMGPDARIRVKLRAGWASYSAQDFNKAMNLYHEEGLDLLLCKDLFDDGNSCFLAAANA